MLSGSKFPIKGRVYIRKNPEICRVFQLHGVAHRRAAGLEMLVTHHCCLFTSHYFLEVILSIWQPPWRLCTGERFCMWTPKAAV